MIVNNKDSNVKAYDLNNDFLFPRTQESELNKAFVTVSKLEQIQNICKDFIDVQESDKRYFLTLAKFNQRSIELMDHVSARLYAQDIKIDKEKIYLTVSNHRSTKLKDTQRDEAYTIEFSQETLLVKDVHKRTDEIEVFKKS